jgi:hypothetical protein
MDIGCDFFTDSLSTEATMGSGQYHCAGLHPPVAPADSDRFEATLTSRSVSGIACRASIAAMLTWSLLEMHWDLMYSTGKIDVAIVLFTKLTILGIGLAALYGSSISLAGCAFCCVVNIVVIAVKLPYIYSGSHTLFYLSMVEAVVKTVTAVSISCYFAREHTAPSIDAIPWRMR